MNVAILKISALVYLGATVLHLTYLVGLFDWAKAWGARVTWAAFGLHSLGLLVRVAIRCRRGACSARGRVGL